MCQYCGKEFVPKKFNWRKKYCSKACNDKAYAKNNPEVRLRAWRKYNKLHREQQKERSKRYYQEHTEEVRKYQKSLRDENNSRTRAKLIAKKGHRNKVCVECGSIKNLHVHHVDFDPMNNELENLRYLCSICHGAKHRSHNDSILKL